METKLLVLPIYPAVALAAGVKVAEPWSWSHPASYPVQSFYFLALLAAVVGVQLYFSPWSQALGGTVDFGQAVKLGD